METSTFIRSCPICALLPRTISIGSKDGFEWKRCGRCRLHYVGVTPDDEPREDYADYYGEDSPVVPALVRKRLHELVKTFEAYRTHGRLLDVGFGAGWLLRAAAEQGWACWGTELASESLEAASTEPWQVYGGDLLDAALPSRHFDVITVVEVLEHLPDPLSYLREAARLLRPGGLLYGTTPNAASLNGRILRLDWSIYAAPEHLQLFTSRALQRALEAAGLQPLRIQAQGLNPAELRSRTRRPAPGKDRVQAAYALNERMERSSSSRAIRTVLNGILSWTRSGDSLKFYARCPIERRDLTENHEGRDAVASS